MESILTICFQGSLHTVAKFLIVGRTGYVIMFAYHLRLSGQTDSVANDGSTPKEMANVSDQKMFGEKKKFI